jgi:hypothetical protein
MSKIKLNVDPLIIRDEANQVAQALELKTEAAREYLNAVFYNATLFDNKQQDYGPGNIAGFGTFGVVVRMNDKFERLKTLFAKKGRKRRAVNETIDDTLRDIANYAVIAILLEGGNWPLKEPTDK